MSERTPTPWLLGSRLSYGRDLITRGLGGGYGGWFVELHSFSDDEQFDANAEFIVRACNAHDDVVAALKAARGYLECCCEPDRSDPASEALAKVDAALAKAKGQS